MSEKMKMKKKQEELNEKLDKIIGIVIGILTLAVVVLVGIIVFNEINHPVDEIENTAGETTSTESTADANMNAKLTELASEKSQQITMVTSKGEIKMNVYPELMPITVENFVKLVKQNFYNGLTFHRVENWVVQGGDPEGNGTGGASEKIKLETNEKLSNVRGALAMARGTQPDTASSQFYFVKSDMTSIDGQYAVFGMVTEGMDVVDSIEIGDTITSVTVSE